MTMKRAVKQPVCPDCGKEQHDPKTGFCWLSRSRNVRSGYHCNHCCITGLTGTVPVTERKGQS